MTLLLTASSFKNVVQVSDRRLTIANPGHAPTIHDDKANKREMFRQADAYREETVSPQHGSLPEGVPMILLCFSA